MAAVKEDLSYDLFRTPWGWIGAVASPRGLRSLALPRPTRAAAAEGIALPRGVAPTPWTELRSGLLAYLRGEGDCPGLPLDLEGVAAFSRQVLGLARAIPRGTTVTYGELARRAGNPRASRAAGQALARNRLPLVIPCHRVVGVAGLGGYAGGLALKRRLLALESGGA